MAALQGPEFDEFPNKTLAAAHDGSGLPSGDVLGRRVEELKAKLDDEKKDNEALEKLSRFRQKMLRSKWVRLGLLLGLCHPLVSNRGKKPHEKLLWLRDTSAAHWWLKLGEKLGSKGCRDLRRGLV
jgi:hypothetical protein